MGDWYRGDCHVHTAVSVGGELTPDQVVVGARAAGLDFIAITEHNSAETHGAWEQHDLLVVLGQEITTPAGHWLALGLAAGQVVDWREGGVDRHVDVVRRGGGLCVVAHPHAPYPTGTFLHPYEAFDVVEMWNGPWRSDVPWQADNEAALAEWGRDLAADVRQGKWRPAMGSSDTHLAGQIGVPHTVVLAEELTSAAVLAGIRAGRTWIAESAAVDLSFTASADGRTAGIGERLDTGGEPAVVTAVVSGVPSGTISFHTEQGRTVLPELHVSAAESAFVRVEVRHPDGRMAALSNPILLR